MLQQLLDQAEREHVVIIHRPLADGPGACAWIAGRPVIYLDPRLPRHQRAEVLAHELAHARRGHRPRPSTPLWQAPAAREERRCDQEAAALLVDLDWLANTIALAEADGVGLDPVDVAAEAGVTPTVAERAMQMLADEHVRKVA